MENGIIIYGMMQAEAQRATRVARITSLTPSVGSAVNMTERIGSFNGTGSPITWNATTCGPVEAFDSAKLPFQWISGLPVLQNLKPISHFENVSTLEVAHVVDDLAGPLWLYAAPGSGTWWRPGRRLVARNVVDAVLRFNTLETVVSHFVRKSTSRGFATTRDHAIRWRTAFRNASWETILLGAAANHGCYGLFAMPIKLFSGLAPMPTAWHGSFLNRWRMFMHKNQTYDSMILVEQMNLWPRPQDRERRQFAEAGTVVEECRRNLPNPRVHRIPELVDFRFPGPSTTALMKSAAVSADPDGKRNCVISDGTVASGCTYCSPERLVLCRCQRLHVKRDARRKCCMAGMGQVQRSVSQIRLT